MRTGRWNSVVVFILILSLLLPTPFIHAEDEVPAEDALVAHYDMSRAAGKLIDVTNHGFNAEYVGFTDGDFIEEQGDTILAFTGDKSKYVKLPKGLINDETFTIETKFSSSTRANHWLYTFGTIENVWPNVTNYIFLNPMQGNGTVRLGIKDSATELLFQNATIEQEKFTTMTTTFEPGVISIYINGELKGTLSHTYSIQDILTNGVNAGDSFIGYIGKSLYTPDPAFTGKLADFKVYNYTLSSAKVKENYLSTEKHLLAHYDMSKADGKLTDITNHGFNAEYVGFTDGDFFDEQGDTILAFTGDGSKYVKLPRGLIEDETFTIETKFKSNTNANHWLYTLGTKENVWPNVSNYIFMNPMQENGTMRFGIKDAATELLFQDATIEPDKYTTLITTFEPGLISFYVDGILKGTLSHTYSVPNILTNGVNDSDNFIGYIGKSLYTPDPAFTGELSEFKVYNYTLSSDEIREQAPKTDEEQVEQAIVELTIPNAHDIRGNITLPALSKEGAVITWLSDRPDVVNVNKIEVENYDDAPPGTVTRQEEDTPVVLTATVTYGSATGTKNIPLMIKAKPEELEYEGYLFTHFTGESASGEQIYFASSQDGLHWKDLNLMEPVLTSNIGEKGVRDPYIFRSAEGDKFYIIATDLRIASGKGWGDAMNNGSKYLIIWESTDLVNWTEPRMVKIGLPDSGFTWAPEAIYDERTGEYLVFWASNRLKPSGTEAPNIYYSKTRDFVSFTEPQLYIDRPDSDIIDTTMIEANGKFYRYSRDHNITIETSDSLLGSWSVLGNLEPLGITGVEGPLIYKFNDRDEWSLMVDQYTTNQGYLPLLSTDLSTGVFRKAEASEFVLDNNLKRHGSVLNITQAEYDAIMNKWAKEVQVPDDPEELDPILWYELNQTTGNTVMDSSGNGHHGLINGGATWGDEGLTFNGTNGYIKVPDHIMANMRSITVAYHVFIDPTQANPYMLFGFGNTDSNGVGKGYLFMTGNSFRAALTRTDWTGEQNVQSGYDLPRGVWKHVAITVSGNTAILYEDGLEVARKTDVTISPYQINNGQTSANYIGRSVYNADKFFKGVMQDFRVYNRALDAGELAALAGNTTAIVDVELEALKTKAIMDQTNARIVLPLKAGTDISKLAPRFILQAGSSIEPATGSVQNFTNPVIYTVTGIDGQKRNWTVEAKIMRSPIIPGLYADPNIVFFDGKYYIYPTTDGFPGWSGTQFKVFSSEDLVNWTDHGVIFDLPKDTTWADARAWAPTAADKNGKYYFYYSADTNIGVAQSDSPTGPFVDPLGKPLIAAGAYSGQMIDPMVFNDDDGQSYLYFGNGNGYVVKLNEDMISLNGSVKDITPSGFREGFFVFKRNDIYYFMWSENDTRDVDYKVAYGTSSSPMGPISKKGVILEKDLSLGIKGPGHHSVVKVPNKDEYYIVYHRFAIPDGDGTHRETTIDKMEFNADGTIKKVIPTLESIEPLGRSSVPGNPGSGETTVNDPNSKVSDTGEINIKAKESNGKAAVQLDPALVKRALEKGTGNTIKINIEIAAQTNAVEVSIPVDQIKTGDIEIDTGLARITISTALLEKHAENPRNVTISVTKADTSGLPRELQEKLKDTTVYDFHLEINGQKVSQFDGKKEIQVAVKYTLKQGENPNHVVLYYITDSGNLEVVKNGRYNPATGEVEFKPKHFSKYAAAYTDVSFVDVTKAWAKDSIEALGARGIVNGIGAGRFNPDGNVTRAEFVAMLIRALDLTEENVETTFMDVKPGAWYYPEIATAQKLGIVSGRTDGSFGANDHISRQEMAVMVYRAVQYDQPKQDGEFIAFTDQDQISSYAMEGVMAMQAAGVIVGMGDGTFAPHTQATRAQAAVIIYRVLVTLL